MVTIKDENVVSVLVPDRHPLCGQQFTIWPQSGATTYNNGTIRFESESLRVVRQGLADLKRALGEKLSEATRK